LRNLQSRVAMLRRHRPAENWPDLDDATLLATLADWLAPFLGTASRRADFARIGLEAALRARLDWRQQQRLDSLAPTHVTVPSGSRLPLDYAAGEAPVLAVRLQEMFGATATPAVLDGQVPVLLHLL